MTLLNLDLLKRAAANLRTEAEEYYDRARLSSSRDPKASTRHMSRYSRLAHLAQSIDDVVKEAEGR